MVTTVKMRTSKAGARGPFDSSAYPACSNVSQLFQAFSTRMVLLLSDVAATLLLLEGGEWDPKLDTLSDRVSAQEVVPAGKSVKIHLGTGLHHGPGEGTCILSRPVSLYYSMRNRAIELTGPLTVRELLQAIGDAQLFECLRNQVLATWLGRAVEDDSSDDPYSQQRPIHCVPLNMEYFKRFESKELTVKLPDGTSKTTSVPPNPICVLDPPADVDPTAGMDLQAMVDLMGGFDEKASTYILWAGSTRLLGLQPVPGPSTGTAAAGCDEEWVATWSEPFG